MESAPVNASCTPIHTATDAIRSNAGLASIISPIISKVLSPKYLLGSKPRYMTNSLPMCSTPLAPLIKRMQRCQISPFNVDLKSREDSSILDYSTAEISKIKKIHGRGGFGTVYCGNIGQKHLCVKKFHSKSNKESFQAEAEFSKLKHPNLVRIFSSKTDIENMYIVMEYAGDRNLQSLIMDKNEDIGIHRHYRFSTDVIEALLFLHEKGLVHMDVKPANIIITPEDRCKLGDFGCSQVNKKLQLSPVTLMGTVAYQSPEQLTGKNISFPADIYAFGITQWQIVARERSPYKDMHHHVIIFGVVSNGLRPRALEHACTFYHDDSSSSSDSSDDESPRHESFHDSLQHRCSRCDNQDRYYARVTTIYKRCWDGSASKRPDAGTLLSEFKYLYYKYALSKSKLNC